MTTIIETRLNASTSLPFSGTTLSALASGTYVQNTTAFNCETNHPLDVVITVTAGTSNAPAGNKRVVVFARESQDGTVFTSGPTTGTDTTDEANLIPLGTLSTAQSGKQYVGEFRLTSATDGTVPSAFYIVLKNDLNVALTSGTVTTTEIQGQIV
jgi:hypothetical protein